MYLPRHGFQLLMTLYAFLICSCNDRQQDTPSAYQILQQCIKVHGGNSYKSMDIAFDFRKYRIRLKQNNGRYQYERSYKDSAGNSWVETIANEGFSIKENEKIIVLPDAVRSQRQEALNAIAYFTLLPFKLADPAVIADYAGTISIQGRLYNKISVTFKKANGGKDHQDEFCYWIDQQTHQLSFLAYSNGGPRFRKATRQNKCGGIIIQDYENYVIKDATIATADYDSVFLKGKFSLLSLIEQTNFQDFKKAP